jgi:uncharacterized protein (DUF433 family)
MTATLAQNLWDEIQTAPEPVQAEVLDFLLSIKAKGGEGSKRARLNSHIQQTPGVCGGEACVGNTRIAVWMLEAARRAGVTDAGLLQDYPSLDARDLAASWSYVEANEAEIANAIQANHEA